MKERTLPGISLLLFRHPADRERKLRPPQFVHRFHGFGKSPGFHRFPSDVRIVGFNAGHPATGNGNSVPLSSSVSPADAIHIVSEPPVWVTPSRGRRSNQHHEGTNDRFHGSSLPSPTPGYLLTMGPPSFYLSARFTITRNRIKRSSLKDVRQGVIAGHDVPDGRVDGRELGGIRNREIPPAGFIRKAGHDVVDPDRRESPETGPRLCDEASNMETDRRGCRYAQNVRLWKK